MVTTAEPFNIRFQSDGFFSEKGFAYQLIPEPECKLYRFTSIKNEIEKYRGLFEMLLDSCFNLKVNDKTTIMLQPINLSFSMRGTVCTSRRSPIGPSRFHTARNVSSLLNYCCKMNRMPTMRNYAA